MFCRKCGNKLQDGEAFCSKCGTKRVTEANKQPAGANTPIAPQPMPQPQPVYLQPASGGISGSLIAGLLFLIGGIIGVIASASTISDDKSQLIGGYTYDGTLTSHESTTIVILVISIIAIVIGGIILLARKR